MIKYAIVLVCDEAFTTCEVHLFDLGQMRFQLCPQLPIMVGIADARVAPQRIHGLVLVIPTAAELRPAAPAAQIADVAPAYVQMRHVQPGAGTV